MTPDKNPLICDPKETVCTAPSAATATEKGMVQVQDKVHIIYYTDPICSSCWGIEPQLRKLKLEYGHAIDIEYRMGGLLPDWSYNSGGISKPSDVAHHWDEVSRHYQMPIDGDVWLEDPLDSSYPPSIAYKAAAIQDKTKAQSFMRRIREMVFLEKRNITRWKHIETAALYVGLDVLKLKEDYQGVAQALFQEDLKLAKQLGVRGFPTLLFINGQQPMDVVYGAQPYGKMIDAIKKIAPNAQPQSYETTWQDMFRYYPTWTTRGYAEVSGVSLKDSHTLLETLHSENVIGKYSSKNGPLWSLLPK